MGFVYVTRYVSVTEQVCAIIFLSINLCEILKVAGYICWVCEIIMSARHMSPLGAQVR